LATDFEVPFDVRVHGQRSLKVVSDLPAPEAPAFNSAGKSVSPLLFAKGRKSEMGINDEMNVTPWRD